MNEEPADWFVRNLQARWRNEGNAGPVFVSDDHRRCLNVLHALTAPSGLYNLPTPFSVTDDVALWPNGGLSVLICTELATYDADRLTRLVVAAHRERVRVAVKPWRADQDETRARLIAAHLSGEWGYEVEPDEVGAGTMEITLHPRKADGHRLYERHPGLDELARSLEVGVPA